MATMDMVDERLERISSRYVEAGRYAHFGDYSLLPDTDEIELDSSSLRTMTDGGRPAPPFIYDVLSHECDRIRLLRITPHAMNSFYGSAPECELSTFDLDSSPPYMALSYSWGSKDCPKHTSYINGRVFQNTWENLYNFMLHFRQDAFNERTKYLWIDQICINMDSKIDRSYNVKLMSRIYREAVDVVSWLGMDELTVGAATCIDEKRASTHHVATLLNNSYFTRLWIVQEILLARKLYFMCGNTWLSLAEFMESIQLHGTSAMRKSPAYYLLSDSIYNPERRNLAQLILEYRHQNCGQPHDRVYALRGLVPEDEQMEVDYNKPIAAVLLDTIRILVRSPFAVGNPDAQNYFANAAMVLAKLMRISQSVQHELWDAMEGVDFKTSDKWYERMAEDLQASIDYEKLQQQSPD